jgi:MFS family permease
MTDHASSIWRYTASSYLPAMVYEIGNGAVLPILVTTAVNLGASTETAAFTLSLLGIGKLLGDVPASWIAERFGDRPSMLGAACTAFLSFLACFLSSSLLELDVAVTVLGMTSSTFYLARQSYLIEVVPVWLRARAQSTLAGSHRVGLFIGPFLGAAAIAAGGVRAAYLVAMATAVAAAVLLLVVRDVERHGEARPQGAKGVRSLTVLRQHRRLFLTLGFAIVGVNAVRQTRQTVLPLWALHIGLSPAQTSLMFGIANAVDAALFYPSGQVMDRWGRLAIAIPAMTIMGAAMIGLVHTHTFAGLILVAMAMSFGNGIGSGIMQTIGADAAPIDGRRRFLGIWRVFSDAGTGIGPVIVSIVAGIATLATGIVVIGGIGFLSAAGLAAWVPKFTAYATPRSVRAHRHSGSPVDAEAQPGPRPS